MQKNELHTYFLYPAAAGFLLGIVILLLPLLVIGKGTAAEQPPLLPAPSPTAGVPSPTPSETQHKNTDSKQTVRILLEDGTTEEMTVAEYLWRVVAAEMPASFESEALRAQAVCARTYTLWKMSAGNHSNEGADLCSSSTCCQAYTTHEKAEQRWADLAEAYTARIADAVEDTDGQILLYDDKPIQAVFFSSSTSSTEDVAAVWGSSVPYLRSVDTPEGEEVPNYRSTVTLSAAELKSLATAAGLGIKLTKDPSEWLTGISYTASGRVSQLKLGGVSIPGTTVRSILGLRSACFTVEEQDGIFTFSVTGYGHGVGMSQYGANAMAADGAKWEEIVTHYYTGAEIGSSTF